MIVVARLKRIDRDIGEAVNQTVFLGDTPGPAASQNVRITAWMRSTTRIAVFYFRRRPRISRSPEPGHRRVRQSDERPRFPDGRQPDLKRRPGFGRTFVYAVSTDMRGPIRILRNSCRKLSRRKYGRESARILKPLQRDQYVRHLVPGSSFQLPSRLLLVHTTPLLEEERHAGIEALIPDVRYPRPINGPGAGA